MTCPGPQLVSGKLNSNQSRMPPEFMLKTTMLWCLSLQRDMKEGRLERKKEGGRKETALHKILCCYKKGIPARGRSVHRMTKTLGKETCSQAQPFPESTRKFSEALRGFTDSKISQ